MGFTENSALKQFSCGDVIPGSTGMLTLAFGPAADQLSGAPAGNAQYPFWFGWYRCNSGEELKRWKNSETHVAYFVTKGSFKILSEGETKTVGQGTWIGFPPATEYEVHCTENGSELLWVYVPPKAG